MAAGPMPRETLDRLLALQRGARFIRGNTDRELVHRHDGTPIFGAVVDKNNVWARRDESAAQQITEVQRDFLASLPDTVTLQVERLGPTLFWPRFSAQ